VRSPRAFSTALETYARFGATLGVWQNACGDSFSSVEPLLAATDRLASKWPGRLPSRPERRVVRLDESRFRAVCDEGLSEPLDLTREQVVLYRADERAIRSAVCEALGLTISRDELAPLPGVLRIGQWRYSQAAGCAVSLACAASSNDLAEMLRATVADGRPHIVLLFTRTAWTTSPEQSAPADRVMVAAFDEVLEPGPDGFTASDGWDAALGEFMRAAKIEAAPGFRAQKNKRIAKTGQTPAKLKAALRDWYRGAKSVLHDRGDLLPAPEVQVIAGTAGVHPTTASRWLNGEYREKDAELKVLWGSTADEQYIRRFKR
ncbi:MAG: hypothetical protein AAFQ71_15610, partial [Planctomycetota bacterium]